jgi:hypothetical protein
VLALKKNGLLHLILQTENLTLGPKSMWNRAGIDLQNANLLPRVVEVLARLTQTRDIAAQVIEGGVNFEILLFAKGSGFHG